MAIGSTILCGCSPSEPPAAPPKIVFQETTHDFGRTAQGTEVTYTYAFHNAGGLDLSIDNVRGSCGCTVAAPSSRILHPGEDGSIAVALDTARESGRQTRTITVYSNDPAQPVTTLSLVGDVDAEVAADPPELYVGHLRRGQAARNEVRLLAADNVSVSTVEGRKITDASLRTVASGTYIRVAIKPDAPPGRFRDMVTVRTNSTRQPLLTIPVVGVVDADTPSAQGAEPRG
jgi:hypothetical protein